MTTSYWNPGMNPFRTLPKDAPARVKEQPRAAPSGPYNDRGGYSGGFRGRGGFSGGRGGMNQTNFNQNRNFNNNMGFNSNMGGGGGFNGPMGGGNFGFNGGRGGMMGGGMRGGPGGMRGGRGGNMMGMGPMGGMPMGMPGNMGMMGMGGGMPGKDAVECIHKALLTSSRLPRHEPQLQRRRLWLQPESRWRWKRRLGQSARSQAPTARMNDLVATLESFRNAITNGADVGEGCTFQTAASCIIGRDGRGHYEFGAQSVCGFIGEGSHYRFCGTDDELFAPVSGLLPGPGDATCGRGGGTASVPVIAGVRVVVILKQFEPGVRGALMLIL